MNGEAIPLERWGGFFFGVDIFRRAFAHVMTERLHGEKKKGFFVRGFLSGGTDPVYRCDFEEVFPESYFCFSGKISLGGPIDYGV